MRAFAIVGLGLAVVGAVGALVVRIVAPVPFLPVTFGFGPAAMIAFITHRVRRDVDRRFNRARYDAEQTVAAFSARVRDEVDIAAVTNRSARHGPRCHQARGAGPLDPQGETMSARTAFPVVIAWLAAVAGAVALVFAGSAGTSLTGSGFSLIFGGLALAVVTDASVGAVLTLRRPGNVVGLLLMLAAILVAVTFLGFVVGAALTEGRGSHDVLAGLASLIGPLGIYPTLIVAGPLTALVFPNGRLPGPRWRWPVRAIVALIAFGSATTVLRPGPPGDSFADNPFGVSGFSGSEPLWAMGDTLAAAALPFALLLAFAAVIVRVRRSVGVERAQLKWFVAANVTVGAFLTISFADGATQTFVDLLAPLSLSLPPIAVGIAILRYRLYDIDRLISRTVSWAVISGALVSVFAGAVVAMQAVLAGFTQGQTLAVAASTLVAFALFQPIRRRVQSAVGRRFDRARYDGQRTVDAFGEQLRNEVDLTRLRAALVATADDAVRPVSATVWLRGGTRVAR